MEDVLPSTEDYTNSVDMRSAQILKLSLEIIPTWLTSALLKSYSPKSN